MFKYDVCMYVCVYVTGLDNKGRTKHIPFLVGFNLGLSWVTFTDLGSEYTPNAVSDTLDFTVASITTDGVITLTTPHALKEPAKVSFSGLDEKHMLYGLNELTVEPVQGGGEGSENQVMIVLDTGGAVEGLVCIYIYREREREREREHDLSLSLSLSLSFSC